MPVSLVSLEHIVAMVNPVSLVPMEHTRPSEPEVVRSVRSVLDPILSEPRVSPVLLAPMDQMGEPVRRVK